MNEKTKCVLDGVSQENPFETNCQTTIKVYGPKILSFWIWTTLTEDFGMRYLAVSVWKWQIGFSYMFKR